MKSDLHSIPFFGHLPDSVLDAIAARLRREHYHKGAVLFSEGDPGHCMYLIESGQVKVFSEKDGRENVLAYLGPGNFFGETALLLADRRSASVSVAIDADLLVLHKGDLDDLLQHHPAIALTLTRELSRRLGRRTPAQLQQSTLIAIAGEQICSFARRLAQLTGEDVFLLDLGGLAATNPDQGLLAQSHVFLALGGSILDPESLPVRLSSLLQQYYWVLVAVLPATDPLTCKALELANCAITIGREETEWKGQLGPKVYWHSPEDETSQQRLIRRISNRQVGLALSSGNARGMAHIGVLKVLETQGIPVDVIAGTSAGAVFGSLYAAGRRIDEIVDFAVRVKEQYDLRTGLQYWDFRILPHSGLIKGDKIVSYLRKWLQNKTFDDMSIPLYIVAVDLISGEEVLFESGPVAEAVRASMSVVGILEPTHFGGRYLIDGGVVNPVPTQILADRGMNYIIASNVIPCLEDRLHRQELKREGRLPNMIGIISGTMEIMESEIIKSRMGPVDLLIQPDVARYGTMDYHLAREIIRCGEEAAWNKISYLRQLIAPRPRPPLRG